MRFSYRDKPLWTLLTGRTMILIGLVGIVLLVLISFPLIENPRTQVDPAADAEATYLSLLSQINPSEEKTPVAHGATSGLPAPAETTLAGDSPDAGQPAAVRRDLFAPIPAEKPAPTRPRSTSVRPTRPRLPDLTGILIDGPSRRAMLGGELVTVGDEIRGYRLVAIEKECVTLQWRQQTYQLELGAK